MNEPDVETRVNHARELLREYPEVAVAAAEKFLRHRDLAALGNLVDAALAFHLPPNPARPALAGMPGTSRLVEDLGLDSLAMVEMTFLLQDVVGIKLADGELRTLTTLDDLRSLIRTRVEAM